MKTNSLVTLVSAMSPLAGQMLNAEKAYLHIRKGSVAKLLPRRQDLQYSITYYNTVLPHLK